MRAFFVSDPGKGTVGVCLTCLILVYLLAGGWLVAGMTLLYALRHFRDVFRRLDTEPEPVPVLDKPLQATPSKPLRTIRSGC